IGAPMKEVVYEYASNASSVPSATDSLYYHTDHISNVVGLTNAGGISSADSGYFEQDAFGNEMNGTWGSFSRHLTAKEYDADCEMYFFSARWLEPRLGRFPSSDPIGFVTNYAYAMNCPTLLIDPTGLYEAIPCDPGKVCGEWTTGVKYGDRYIRTDTKVLVPWHLVSMHFTLIDAGPPAGSLTCVAQRVLRKTEIREKYKVTTRSRICSQGNTIFVETGIPKEESLGYTRKTWKETEEQTVTVLTPPWLDWVRFERICSNFVSSLR
ncbi:MAG TPA: RHS repeat-associated core domain-containing protein, partial [bacterium]|nr:RHS repeat-associated core domain-containing protein [bacterium]